MITSTARVHAAAYEDRLSGRYATAATDDRHVRRPFCRPSSRRSAAGVRYAEGKPLCRIAVPAVEGIENFACQVDVMPFGMPTGPVLAFCLRLSAETGVLGFVDHVFDLSAEADLEYLQTVRAAGALIVVLAGADGHVCESYLEIKSEALQSHLENCAQYLAQLDQPNGPQAVNDFVAVYEPVMREQNDVAAA